MNRVCGTPNNRSRIRITKLPFARQKGLEEAIEKLGAELHTEYLVSFSPEAPAPGYHRIEVRVKQNPELRIRARPGYWSEDVTASRR